MFHDRSNTTDRVPARKPTTYSCGIARTPSTEATGMLPISAARARSAPIISRRSAADPVEPDPGRQREEQVREQPERRQRPHLASVGAEGQDRDERQAEQGDLVAEDRDRLAEPESPEVGRVEEERRQSAPERAGTQTRSGVPRALLRDQVGGFCFSASCFWTSLSISSWRFCRTRLTMISPKIHGQMSATTSPTRSRQRPVGRATVSRTTGEPSTPARTPTRQG